MIASFNYLLIILAVFLLLSLLIIRVVQILPNARSSRSYKRPRPRPRGTPSRTVIVLGSGGHTAEMLSLLTALPSTSYTHRTYVVSSGDAFSASKAADFESQLLSKYPFSTKSLTASGTPREYGNYDIATVPRARKIHQPLWSTPFSCLWCLVACLRVLVSRPEDYEPPKEWPHAYPALILTNGPATGLIVVTSALLLRFLGLRGTEADGWSGMRSVFVESWARVRKLSLSGRIIVAAGLCERVVVQWEALVPKGDGNNVGRTEFVGALVR